MFAWPGLKSGTILTALNALASDWRTQPGPAVRPHASANMGLAPTASDHVPAGNKPSTGASGGPLNGNR